MSTVHNGFIKDKFKNSFKESDLNNFDLGTTRVFKGVKPMWDNLGFPDESYDVPGEKYYWGNIIPKIFFFNGEIVHGHLGSIFNPPIRREGSTELC